MLESMIKAPRPTRAEASDVANAVLDGSDCVMLSGECANGDYPIQAVTIMAKCCIEAENTMQYRRQYLDLKTMTKGKVDTAESVASAAVQTSLDLELPLIIVLTEGGKLARVVSKYRPQCKILACSLTNSVVRQMNYMRGVIGLKIPTFQGTDNVINFVIEEAKKMGLCNKGQVAVIHGTDEDSPDESNIFKILEL